MKSKKPFYYKSSFWVHVYAGAIVAMIVFEIIAFRTHLNETMVMPIEVMADLWVAIVSLYIGVDRAMLVVKSTTLNYGEVDVGEPGKIREIIAITSVLLILAITGAYYTALDFSLDQFAAAFGASIALYVAGQKGIQTAKWTGIKDDNYNGIPDEEEEAYERWARKQKREGVESRFITYDYYKDELFYKEEETKNE